MPYAHQKLKIPRSLDRRVKLSDDDKDTIRNLYAQNVPIRGIARLYQDKCSRRTIQYTLRPDLYERMLANAKKRRAIKGTAQKEYGRIAWNETIREHRHYKQSIKDKLT